MTASEIQAYWDERAQLHPERATTDDLLLRDLEFKELSRRIERLKPRTVLDAGCGDGRTTARLAQRFPAITFQGIDYSPAMIDLAVQTTSHLELPNLSFTCLDLFNWAGHTDLAITTRALINLEDGMAQNMAIEHLLEWSKHVVLIENFIEPHNRLNELRANAGLPPIAVRPHNSYFDSALASEGFADAYYFVTRVAYSRMCADTGEPIHYDHPICKAAAQLPQNIGIAVAPMRVIQL